MQGREDGRKEAAPRRRWAQMATKPMYIIRAAAAAATHNYVLGQSGTAALASHLLEGGGRGAAVVLMSRLLPHWQALG